MKDSRGFLSCVPGFCEGGVEKEEAPCPRPLVPFIRDALPAAEDSLCVEIPNPPTHAGAGGPGIPGAWSPPKAQAACPFSFWLLLLVSGAPLPHPRYMVPVVPRRETWLVGYSPPPPPPHTAELCWLPPGQSQEREK